MSKMSGEFVIFLDADDLLLPNAIRDRLQALRENNADVAYSDWQKYQEISPGLFEKNTIIARTIDQVNQSPDIAAFTEFWCPPAALMYRRVIVDKIGDWKQAIAPIEDARFFLDALLLGAKLVHVPGVSALYRISIAPSHSRRSSLAFVRAVFRNGTEIENFWVNAGLLNSERKKVLVDCYSYCARTFHNEDYQLFDVALKKIYQLAPGFDWRWPKIVGVLDKYFGKKLANLTLKLLKKNNTSDS